MLGRRTAATTAEGFAHTHGAAAGPGPLVAFERQDAIRVPDNALDGNLALAAHGVGGDDGDKDAREFVLLRGTYSLGPVSRTFHFVRIFKKYNVIKNVSIDRRFRSRSILHRQPPNPNRRKTTDSAVHSIVTHFVSRAP